MKNLILIIRILLICVLSPNVFAQDLSKPEILLSLDLADSLISENEDSLAGIILEQLEGEQLRKSSDELSIYYYKLLGDNYLSLNQYEKAILGYKPLLNYIGKELGKDPSLKLAKGINDFGIALMKTGQVKKAIEAHFHSIELYSKFNDPMGGSYNYNNLGVIYKELKKIDSAIYFHEKSLEFARLAKDTLGVGFNHLNIGVLRLDNKDVISAIDHFQTALQLFELMNHESMVVSTKGRIARVYMLLKDFESSLTLQNQALSYYEYKGSKYNIARVCIGKAELFLNLKEFDSAKYYVERSIPISEELGYAKGSVNAFNILGQYFSRIKEYDSAIFYYKKSHSLAAGRFLGMEANNLKGLAQVSLQKKNYDEAIALAKESLLKNEHSASIGNLAGTYKVLYLAHKSLEEKSQALTYLELYNEKKEMVFGEEQTLEIARIEYRNRLAQERISRQEEERIRQLAYEQELAQKRWIIAAVITITSLISLIAFVLFRNYKIKKDAAIVLSEKNQKLEELRLSEQKSAMEVIETKERELATMAMASHEKNNVLGELKQKISFLESRMPEDLTRSLKEVKKTISESISLDDSWDSFIHKFEDVHPKFFDRLKNDNPKLTINDLKLSAYLKIGMSNKEIANVSHLTLGSVKSNINRLKKKLELGPDDSLRDYIFKYA